MRNRKTPLTRAICRHHAGAVSFTITIGAVTTTARVPPGRAAVGRTARRSLRQPRRRGYFPPAYQRQRFPARALQARK